MKVGIITVHSVPNYGAVLQSYASATYLRSQGVDAYTIDYRQPDLEKVYRLPWQFPPLVNGWIRKRRNTSFVEGRLPLSPGRYHSVNEFLPDIKNYDAFITGSDQVWFTGPVQYFDPMYFLDFPAPGKRKISYAASAGGTTAFGEFEGRVRKALADFNHIGVRDSHTAQLVAPLAPHAPVQVVDPVFLCDFAAILGKNPSASEPYLLVFGDFSGPRAAALRSVIKATGIRTVVTLQYPCSEATRRIAAPSPPEWLTWFRHASFVVTSYFHGAAIASKFERPFISIPTPGRRIKVATMLSWMGLENRCFLNEPTPTECAERAVAPIDWAGARQKIGQQVALSQAFLSNALK